MGLHMVCATGQKRREQHQSAKNQTHESCFHRYVSSLCPHTAHVGQRTLTIHSYFTINPCTCQAKFCKRLFTKSTQWTHCSPALDFSLSYHPKQMGVIWAKYPLYLSAFDKIKHSNLSLHTRKQSVQKAFQVSCATGMTQFTQCFCLNLPNPFTGNVELLSDFLQCARSAVIQTEP